MRRPLEGRFRALCAAGAIARYSKTPIFLNRVHPASNNNGAHIRARLRNTNGRRRWCIIMRLSKRASESIPPTRYAARDTGGRLLRLLHGAGRPHYLRGSLRVRGSEYQRRMIFFMIEFLDVSPAKIHTNYFVKNIYGR